MAQHVTANAMEGGLEIASVEHPLAKTLDTRMVAGCLQAVFDCADRNACLQDRFAFTAACFKTVSRHNMDSKCLTTGLGAARTSAAQYVRATHTGGTLAIQVDHPIAKKLDAKLVAGCLQSLFECADKNACLDRGFALTAACFDTFSKHNAETKCLGHRAGV